MSELRRRLCGVGRIALALFVAGCSDTTGGSTGRLRVQLTDAPFPFDSVARADIFIVRIDAKTAEADEAEAEDEADPGENHDPARGWVTLATPNARYNLLDLQNGTTVNLGEATLPTGSYQGFRLILDTDQSSITLKNGTVLNGSVSGGIKWPSAGKTGIKIVLEQAIDVTANGTVMVLDFDLGRSFVMRGNSISKNGLLFKPVIHALARDITGSVSGTVRADNAGGALVADANVELLKAGTTLTDADPANVIRSGKTDAAGAFKLAFIVPGAYSLRATPPSTMSATYNAVLKTGVAVSSGMDAAGNVLILPHK